MPTIDVSFRVNGNELPADHGYIMLSAVSELIPDIHGDPECGIFPVNGILIGNRRISLNDKSRLVFRTDVAKLPSLLKLAGKKLLIGEHPIRIGVPEVFALKPAGRLKSRLVTIKGFMEPELFLKAATKQLLKHGIKGNPALITRKSSNGDKEGASTNECPFIRRTLRIKDKEIVGYPMIVEELDDDESIRLQEKGIGGRRRMGCGLFIPIRDV